MGNLNYTVSGDIASFRTPSRVPIESLKFHFLPKQVAGTPSPENPIPITGWTGLNGRRSHKNLIKPYYTDTVTQRGITVTPTDNGVRVTGTASVEHPVRLSVQDIRRLEYGKKYTFSLYLVGDISGCKDPYLGYNTGETYKSIRSLEQTNNYIFTWTVPDSYANASAPWFDMYIRVKEGSTVDFEIGLQMETGENATSYEPYSEELIPITFPDGETIYGGYIDPIAGEIVATFKKINLKNKAWYYYTSTQFALNTDKKLLSDKVFCDMLPVSKINGYPTDDKSIGFWGNGQSYANIIFIKYEASNDTNDFKAWLNSLESDPCLIYEFDTPIHIPIAAQDMKAFLDHNNFWSDANDITEVTYAVTESKDILATRKKAMAFDHAHHKKVKWNQVSIDGNFALNATNYSWNTSYGTLNIADNKITWTSTAVPSQYYNTGVMYKTNYLQIPWNHKILVMARVRTSASVGNLIRIFGMVSSSGGAHTYDYNIEVPSNEWAMVKGFIRDRPENPPSGIDDTIIKKFKILIGKKSGYEFDTVCPIGTKLECNMLMAFDLTQMFGLGNEPQTVAEFEHICEINGIDLTTYQPYDEGSDRWLIVP